MKKHTVLEIKTNLQIFKEEWDKLYQELDVLERRFKKTTEIFDINRDILYHGARKKPEKSLLLKEIDSHKELLQRLTINKEKTCALLKRLDNYSKEDKSTVSTLRKNISTAYKFVRRNEIVCHYYLATDYLFCEAHYPKSYVAKTKRGNIAIEQLQNTYDQLLSCWEKMLSAQKENYPEDFSSDYHKSFVTSITTNHSLAMFWGWPYDLHTQTGTANHGSLLTYYYKLKANTRSLPSFSPVFVKQYQLYLMKKTF